MCAQRNAQIITSRRQHDGHARCAVDAQQNRCISLTLYEAQKQRRIRLAEAPSKQNGCRRRETHFFLLFFFSRPDPKILKTSREAEVTCVESAQAFHSRRQPFISSSISIYLRSHRCACDAHPYFRCSARRSTQTARKVKRAARILD